MSQISSHSQLLSPTQRVRYPLRNKNELTNVATEKEKREYIHLSAFASKPEAAFAAFAVGCFCGVVRFFFAPSTFALANNAFTLRLCRIGGLGGFDKPELLTRKDIRKDMVANLSGGQRVKRKYWQFSLEFEYLSRVNRCQC
jgi:hypothetical protein